MFNAFYDIDHIGNLYQYGNNSIQVYVMSEVGQKGI